MAYDNYSAGEKKLPWPNAGENWENEGAEANEQLDDHIILWTYTGDAANAINVEPSSSAEFFVATLAALPLDARWTLGASGLREFDTINQTYIDTGGTPPTSVGGRVDPFIHGIDPNDVGITPEEVGIINGIGNPMQPHRCEFAIWIQNSQTDYIKWAHVQVPVYSQVL